MKSTDPSAEWDLVVVGGGLAGLTAAAVAARAGLRVVLLEKNAELGGRAQTQIREGFSFNLGAHALYQTGAGMRVLRELGIEPQGSAPSASGGFAIHGGVPHTLPGGPISLITTGLLGLGAKLEVARLLSSITRLDTTPLLRLSLREGLEQISKRAAVRELLQALVRLTSYTNDPEQQSAGAALDQLRLALSGNVLYLDGGWQTLVTGLRASAMAHGAEICTGSGAVRVDGDDSVRSVSLRNGGRLTTRAVILAMGPEEASRLVREGRHAELARWSAESIPVRAACLDLALRELPRPGRRFALGIDRPNYYSVHSSVAALAPTPGALVHLVEYLPSDGTRDPGAVEADLVALMDSLQPGWRERVVHRRFLPHVTVSHRLVSARDGGLAGRPGPAVPGFRGLFVAGDWVGREGQLADASLASGHRAGSLAAAAVAASPARAA